MRVLHLTTHLNIGGITTYIERLIRPMAKLGVDTYIVSSGGEKAAELEDLGAKVILLPIRTKNEFHPKVLFAVPRLKRILTENKIQLIHAHTRTTQVLAQLSKGKLPVVTTSHGFYKNRLSRRLFPAWGDKVIAISQLVGEDLKKFGVEENKVCLISNAVDVESLDLSYKQQTPAQAKKDYGFHATDPVIGITARLVSDKGHADLIQALQLLLPKFPHLRLLIVGDGKCRGTLTDLVRDKKLSDHVHFTGNVLNISHPLAAMDIFALPATWREGFGLSLIEAMTCHKPVIVSNIWALNTLVQDRKNGLMVEAKQPQALASAIEQLLTQPALVQSLTANARAMVEERFQIDFMAKRVKEVYGEALQGKP